MRPHHRPCITLPQSFSSLRLLHEEERWKKISATSTKPPVPFHLPSCPNECFHSLFARQPPPSTSPDVVPKSLQIDFAKHARTRKKMNETAREEKMRTVNFVTGSRRAHGSIVLRHSNDVREVMSTNASAMPNTGTPLFLH